MEQHADQVWVRTLEMSNAERTRVVALLFSLRRIDRVHIGRCSPAIAPSGMGLFKCSPFPRLHLVLSGTYHLNVPRDSCAGEELLERGQAAYWPPSSSSEELWDIPVEVLGISLMGDAVRVARIRNPRDYATSGRMVSAWHTDRPLGATGAAVAAILDAIDGQATAAAPLFAVLLGEIAAELTRQDASDRAAEAPADAGGAAATWTRALGYLADHLAEPISRATTAQALGIHPNHLSRLSSRHAGIAFKDVLRDMRLARAAEFLAGTNLTVAHIAAACGYGGAGHFIKIFRMRHRMTPVQVRAAHQPC